MTCVGCAGALRQLHSHATIAVIQKGLACLSQFNAISTQLPLQIFARWLLVKQNLLNASDKKERSNSNSLWHPSSSRLLASAHKNAPSRLSKKTTSLNREEDIGRLRWGATAFAERSTGALRTVHRIRRTKASQHPKSDGLMNISPKRARHELQTCTQTRVRFKKCK